MFRQQSKAVAWSFPLLILAGGCQAAPECDSFETRNAVLQVVSDDHNNALAKYAAKHAAKNSAAARSESNYTKPQAEKSKNLESTEQKPLYLLGEKIVTRSVSKDKKTLTCSGAISATVGDTKASKEVNFTVQQSSDGKISVSVAPFEFQAP